MIDADASIAWAARMEAQGEDHDTIRDALADAGAPLDVIAMLVGISPCGVHLFDRVVDRCARCEAARAATLEHLHGLQAEVTPLVRAARARGLQRARRGSEPMVRAAG